MLLCVAMFGTLISCTDDNGGYSVPSNDNEIYNLLIGKWNVQMTCVSNNSGDLHFRELSWTGTMEFKESGELVANVTWRLVNIDRQVWQASGSAEGSWALYKRHIDLIIPGDLILSGTDLEGGVFSESVGSPFDYSGTIQSITENSMVILANQPWVEFPVACKFQCTKIE